MSPRLFVSTFGLVASLGAQAAAQFSSFDSGNDGWLVSDIAALPGAGGAAPWDAANQRIRTSDTENWTTFSAPAAWLGDLSVYYGGVFFFELQDQFKDANADTVATFGISSGSTALFWFGGSPSTTFMTGFGAGLYELDTRWRLGGLPTDITTGTLPSAAQFQAVLSAVTAIRINADWQTGADEVALDNVVLLSPVPEPTPALLLAAGLAAVAWRRRAAR